ncbi:MAG TPA: DUF1003 domain-containing protein [Thermomicrobiaceae bacterium]|nr:DUF1003 domain-containing protein [Thermomicrobiaceae bacterium]
MAIPDERLRESEQRARELEARLRAHLQFLRQHQRPPRNVNQELEDSFSTLDRVAIFITDHVGTFGFFIIIFCWTVLWLGWNTLGPRSLRFDPRPAFVLWLFISNMIQIFLMPLIMIGQNLQNRHSELRAENDFEINQKAEREIEAVLLHLEHQAALLEHQQQLTREILSRLDTPRAQAPAASVPAP